jgi:hypothetical protein
MGEKEQRAPFLIESERHLFDVFMNQYHVTLSKMLGCNTNVQCGIDGGHLMYVTYYASKATQAEDKVAYCRVARTLYKRIRIAEENAENGIDVDNPFQEGYRRLLSSILSHTESTVVSGPMAWFIMRNRSRFLFSHDHSHTALEAFLGRSTPSRLVNIHGNAVVLNRCDDYVHRPEELEDLNWYEFTSGYEVINISKSNEDAIMRFSSDEHALRKFRGVRERKHKVTPIVSYLDFPDAADFGGNILNSGMESNSTIEKFAKAALCLFVPFRDKHQFTNETEPNSHVQQLRQAVESNAISGQSLVLLQNIQNCRNMMRAGRQKDILERTTDALPDPERNARDHDDETQREIDDHIETYLSEIVSGLDEENSLCQLNTRISLDEFRKGGKENCGYDGITANMVDENSCVFEMHINTARHEEDDAACNSCDEDEIDDLPRNPRRTQKDQIMSKARLTSLLFSVTNRIVENSEEVEDKIANGSTESIQEWAASLFSDPETGERDYSQQRAFEVIVSMFLLTFHDEAENNENRKIVQIMATNLRARYKKLRNKLKKMTGMKNQQQLIMFMTGAGGSGKTKVINAVMLYAKRFCQTIGYEFDKRMIVVTALTGVAATLINGETTHSAAKLNCKKLLPEHILEWKKTRLVIIDEISFGDAAFLTKLHTQLQALKEAHGKKFGNLHIIFTGDFCQLEPVKGHPLYYETNFAMWHDWVNCFIELTGQHRFKTDPSFGAIMNRVHKGCPTTADIALLNSRVLNGTHPNSPKESDMPDDVAYAVYRNADKSAINNGVFAEHIKKTHSMDPSVPIPLHTLVVRSDDLTWKCNNKAFGPTARHSLWSGCSDIHVKTTGEQGKFVDPFLKLSTNVPLMYTENHDVPNGIANGTLCNLVKVVLHSHVTEADFDTMNIDGYFVRTIDATKVNYLLCKIHGSARTFEVRANTVSCKMDLPFELTPGEKIRKVVRAKANRFPVLINHATTGHKLQGQTKSSLCISDWHYGANWPYVVLSRVTSLKGLFLLKPIRKEHDFSHDARLTRMLNRMRKREPEQYDPECVE